jgi:hypothetical protein
MRIGKLKLKSNLALDEWIDRLGDFKLYIHGSTGTRVEKINGILMLLRRIRRW